MSRPPSSKSLLEFFSRSLAAFQSSSDPFRVLCTLPHGLDDGYPAPAPQPPHISKPSPARSITVLDSSFNPPTTAHMSMLRSARSSAAQRVLLLLSVNNADKAPKPASFEQRLCMMECFGREFLQGEEADEVQVDVGVTTRPYFTDKAAVIAESDFYGGMYAEQVFLAGFDTLIRIFDAKYYKEGGGMRQSLEPFFDRCRLRVTTRPDDKWGSTKEQSAYLENLRAPGGEFLAAGGNVDWIGRIEMVAGEEGDGVSSSKVRDMVKEGGLGEGDRLVGREVREWIQREALYRQD